MFTVLKILFFNKLCIRYLVRAIRLFYSSVYFQNRGKEKQLLKPELINPFFTSKTEYMGPSIVPSCVIDIKI